MATTIHLVRRRDQVYLTTLQVERDLLVPHGCLAKHLDRDEQRLATERLLKKYKVKRSRCSQQECITLRRLTGDSLSTGVIGLCSAMDVVTMFQRLDLVHVANKLSSTLQNMGLEASHESKKAAADDSEERVSTKTRRNQSPEDLDTAFLRNLILFHRPNTRLVSIYQLQSHFDDGLGKAEVMTGIRETEALPDECALLRRAHIVHSTHAGLVTVEEASLLLKTAGYKFAAKEIRRLDNKYWKKQPKSVQDTTSIVSLPLELKAPVVETCGKPESPTETRPARVAKALAKPASLPVPTRMDTGPDEINQVTTTPAARVVTTPAVPVVTTPTAPVMTTPAVPVVTTPTAPVVTTPAVPVVTTPATPVVTTPVPTPIMNVAVIIMASDVSKESDDDMDLDPTNWPNVVVGLTPKQSRWLSLMARSRPLFC